MTAEPSSSVILLQYQGVLMLADGVLLNIIACRIYHSVTVGILRRDLESVELSSITFQTGSVSNLRSGEALYDGLATASHPQVPTHALSTICITPLTSFNLHRVWRSLIAPYFSMMYMSRHVNARCTMHPFAETDSRPSSGWERCSQQTDNDTYVLLQLSLYLIWCILDSTARCNLFYFSIHHISRGF